MDCIHLLKLVHGPILPNLMICARKTGMGMTIYQTVKVADFSHKKLEPI